jgi:PAS domain S-box-containing protein
MVVLTDSAGTSACFRHIAASGWLYGLARPPVPPQVFIVSADDDFLNQLASPRFCERLFAHLPDVVFCLKDRQRRYRAANLAFAQRLGFNHPRALLGRMADEFFSPDLAAAYREQDLQVLESGREMSDRLELVTNRDGSLGWYLATKVPLHDAKGAVIGLASISRDLGTPSEDDTEYAGIARTVAFIQANLEEDLRPDELAAQAGLSPSQLDRRMRKVFHLTTSQFIRKARIDTAVELLTTSSLPVAEIALRCGYGDQTAFSRQFRSTVGMPPAAYRDHARRHA